MEFKVKKYNQEGDLAHEYRAFRNKTTWENKGENIKSKQLKDFRTNEISVDLNNPLSVDCQPSYDGTVNLIVNDDKNPPRIINSRFSVLENNRYKIINRNQKEQTNLYEQGSIDQQTRLFRNINNIPRIQLMSVDYFGQLMGGNYTFYIKFGDNDYNKTDIVAESGQVAIFNGTLSSPATITGTTVNERTDKAISIRVNNIDTSFQKVYLYYTRETCDTNGVRITEACAIKQPYDIKNNYLNITINGYEEVEKINEEELNIKYLYVDSVKTQAQNQGMLFFGNVEQTTVNPRDLQTLSLYVKVSLKQDTESIGYVTTNYTSQETNDSEATEYYNPQNIYYKLGYWPDELYRLGIVYIMRDDSLTDVFNLRGIKFTTIKFTTVDEIQSNLDAGETQWYVSKTDQYGKELDIAERELNYINKEDFIENTDRLCNTMGVFQLPKDVSIWNHKNQTTCPLHFEISFPEDLQERLRVMGVKGFFIVRQKRIPTTLCQGISIGIDRMSNVPLIPVMNDKTNTIEYITESFINETGTLSTNYKKRTVPYKATSALLSIDPCVVPTLQSMFDGSEYVIQKSYTSKFQQVGSTRRYVQIIKDDDSNDLNVGGQKINTIFVDEDIPYKYIQNQAFSTRAGAAEEAKQISFLGEKNYNKDNYDLLRGIWCPIIGLSQSVEDGCIYNIKIRNFSTVFMAEYFKIRGHDNSPFYAISDRYEITESFDDTNPLKVYRGDCYTCTVTMRIQRNFTDPDVPTNELIVDPNTWKDHYEGYNSTDEENWLDINRGDINSVPIGTWVTWKCLSNYNLGLRSQDFSNYEEMALMGNPRSFFPISGSTVSVSNKVSESKKLNQGYCTTVGQKMYLPIQDVPYTKDIFDTRIMFSNVQENDAFRNAYRIFQGLSYKDMDRQYGGLVKLITWGVNLLGIFEHGIAIIPVNEKALLSTNTGQAIHMYGAGVLQNQMTIVTQDYGSIWQESILRTPMGVYGVDTYAKKIWRVNTNGSLELISDGMIQRFLNDNIKLKEKDKYPTIALKNVKTHYNNYKGDIMFTFYNDEEETEWNICYNERTKKWVTRYSWVPLCSENVNNIFYSLDKKRASILSYIYDNINASDGIVSVNSESNVWTTEDGDTHIVKFDIKGYDIYNKYHYEIKNIQSSYISDDGIEQFVSITPELHTEQNTGNYEWIKNTVYIPGDKDTPGSFNPDNGREGELKLTNILEYNGKSLYYWKFIVEVTPYVETTDGDNVVTVGTPFRTIFGIVREYETLSDEQKTEYQRLLQNGFYVHGRAGIFDEIDYFDFNPDNNIMPTKWYDKQEPFEFEFVVNEQTGLHKIFNDLVIISNNVAPEEIEYEIVGDVYHFNKAGIFRSLNDKNFSKPNITSPEWDPLLNPVKDNYQISQQFYNTELKWDPILNQYTLVTKQPCADITKIGRRLGNLHYKEDAWYLQIDPIKFYKKQSYVVSNDRGTKQYGQNVEYETEYRSTEPKLNNTRIRDKWIKIRVKYTGKDLALISAIKTMLTISYA